MTRNTTSAKLKGLEETKQHHEHNVTVILIYNLGQSCSVITDGSHRVNDKLVYFDLRGRK